MGPQYYMWVMCEYVCVCVRSFKHSAELNWKKVDEHTSLKGFLYRPTSLRAVGQCEK